MLKTISTTFLLFTSVIAPFFSLPSNASSSPDNASVSLKSILPNESLLEKRYICKGCNENENAALAHFQDVGIRDKNALATIMGNIRQESTFVPNICEGGSIVPYQYCRRGGYGLIQFTASSRYNGLGMFSKQTNGDPSTLHTQLQYIITEPEWKKVEDRFKQPGKTINQYMRYAYSWLGWGIHGARTNYAHEYLNRLTYQPVIENSDS